MSTFEEITTIEGHEEFIKKFDGLARRNADELHAESLVQSYKNNLKDLELSQKKMRKIFEIEEKDFKKMERNFKYPILIKRYHESFSTGISALILAGAAIGLNLLLRGPDMTTWTSSFVLMNTASGLIAAIPAWVISSKHQKKHFDRGNPRLLDKLLMKRVLKKEAVRAKMARVLNDHIEGIVKGDFDIYKTEKYNHISRIREKKGEKKKQVVEERERIVLKDEFRGLPILKRKKVEKLFKRIVQSQKELKSDYASLSSYSEKFDQDAILTNTKELQIAEIFAKIRGEDFTGEKAAIYYLKESRTQTPQFIEDNNVARILADAKSLEAVKMYSLLTGKEETMVETIKTFIADSKSNDESFQQKMSVIEQAQSLLHHETKDFRERIALYAEISGKAGISIEEAALLYSKELLDRNKGTGEDVFTKKSDKVEQLLSAKAKK